MRAGPARRGVALHTGVGRASWLDVLAPVLLQPVDGRIWPPCTGPCVPGVLQEPTDGSADGEPVLVVPASGTPGALEEWPL